jgi:hypothetical protein
MDNLLENSETIFSKIESTPEINLIKTINEINIFYEKKKKKQNGEVKVEFQIVLDPDIKWDHPEYELVLLDCNYYKFKGLIVYLQEGNYQRCICRYRRRNPCMRLEMNHERHKQTL